ncbi:MAG: carbamoyltransferase C-terminal domain-containing protein [Candidatus Woesearchaeota archaeon]
MKILAISDSKTESGIAFYEDGKLQFALNEERVSRKKIDGSFPYLSLEYFYKRYTGVLDSIDMVVFAGIHTPAPISRIFNFLVDIDVGAGKRWYGNIYRYFDYLITYQFRLLSSVVPGKRKRKPMISLIEYVLRKRLHPSLRDKPISFVDHHMCHASATFYTSGFNEALVASFDGFGDGASGKLYLADKDGLRPVLSIDALDSFGLYYSLITEFLGFTPEKHEGKVTGLAAYGDYTKVKEKFPFKLTMRKNPKYLGRGGMMGLRDIHQALSDYRKEDVAAWLQHNTEMMICDIVSHYMRRFNQRNIAIAGGLTANVKINQKIHELKEVKAIYIYPAMSDMGASHGAILSITKIPESFDHVFYGPRYDESEIEDTLKRKGMKYRHYNDIEKKIAKLLSKGNVVARFNGRMEYGPRALGNRSVLVHAVDKSINNSLNEKLKRTEFMPFAPTILEESADRCLKGLKGAERTSKFMNISFRVTDYMRETCPAAVHVDGTARPQIISKKDNASYYRIIEEYNKITGIPAILNTSFNVHEEPIVMTPEDAINGFRKAGLDYLAIGNFLVENGE